MAKKQSAKRKTPEKRSDQRWASSVADEIARPKKPEHLNEVLSYLSPFPHDKQAAALKAGLCTDEFDEPWGVSKELAARLVKDAARRFNTEEQLARFAPRIGDVVKNLMNITKRALKLCQELESLDDFTRGELQYAGTDKWKAERFRGAMEGADVEALPQVGSQAVAKNAWTERLRSLALYADLVRQDLESRAGKDVGGATNLWKQFNGVPKWGLVYDATVIYDIFKSGQMTSTELGDFRLFVEHLFEYATGKEGDQSGSVRDWIKKLVNPYLKHKAARTKTLQLDAEWNKILDSDPELLNQSNRKRLFEIRKEENTIWAEREALRPKLWPPGPRSARK